MFLFSSHSLNNSLAGYRILGKQLFTSRTLFFGSLVCCPPVDWVVIDFFFWQLLGPMPGTSRLSFPLYFLGQVKSPGQPRFERSKVDSTFWWQELQTPTVKPWVQAGLNNSACHSVLLPYLCALSASSFVGPAVSGSDGGALFQLFSWVTRLFPTRFASNSELDAGSPLHCVWLCPAFSGGAVCLCCPGEFSLPVPLALCTQSPLSLQLHLHLPHCGVYFPWGFYFIFE